MYKKTIKPICFYLPQYHPIQENDDAYGVGFTEWTNVKKARPLFEGHNQPRIPLNNNYYSLLNPEVMRNQSEIAQAYGIYGFCYYHYWFRNGKKLLEKPIEMMLQNSSITIPFCLCWANENWTKRWDGGNNEIIMEQDYGDFDDLKKHVDYLCEFFRDKRYIRIDNMPLLLIYKPELIPHLKDVIKFIRKRVLENGFDGVKIAVQYPKFILDEGNLSYFDYLIEFEPQFIQSFLENEKRKPVQKFLKRSLLNVGFESFVKKIEEKRIDKYKRENPRVLQRCSYDDYWESILSHKVSNKKMIAGAFVDWDNTPRNVNGRVFENVSPEKFGEYMYRYKKKVLKEYVNEFVFINAWNEWAEGAYLEPDEKNEYGFLKALKNALES